MSASTKGTEGQRSGWRLFPPETQSQREELLETSEFGTDCLSTVRSRLSTETLTTPGSPAISKRSSSASKKEKRSHRRFTSPLQRTFTELTSRKPWHRSRNSDTRMSRIYFLLQYIPDRSMLITRATDDFAKTRESSLPFNLHNIIELPSRIHRKTSSTASDVFRRSPDQDRAAHVVPMSPGLISSSPPPGKLHVLKNGSHPKSRTPLRESTFRPANPQRSSLKSRPPSSGSVLSSTPDIPEPTAEVIEGLVGLYSTDPVHAMTFASDAKRARLEETRQQVHDALEMAEEQGMEQQEQHDDYEYGHEHDVSELQTIDQEKGGQNEEPQRSDSSVLRVALSSLRPESAAFDDYSDIQSGSSSAGGNTGHTFDIPVQDVPLNMALKPMSSPQNLEDVPEEEEEFRRDNEDVHELRINISSRSSLETSADTTNLSRNNDSISEFVGSLSLVDSLNEQVPKNWHTRAGSRQGFVALGAAKTHRRGYSIPPKPVLMVDADDDDDAGHQLLLKSSQVQGKADSPAVGSGARQAALEDTSDYSPASPTESKALSSEQQLSIQRQEIQQPRSKQYKQPLFRLEQLSPREERFSYSSATTGCGTSGRQSQVSSLTSAEVSDISRLSMSYLGSADAFCTDDKPDTDDSSPLNSGKYYCEVEGPSQASNRGDKSR